MEENKKYRQLYTLDSFLKFEKKIYQFAGLSFGRPLKIKTVFYFIIFTVILIGWRFTPVLGFPIRWIPIVALLIFAGVAAWLLTDVGTEGRNPAKYFKSVFTYQYRKLRKVTYHRGREKIALQDYDVSAHITVSLPYVELTKEKSEEVETYRSTDISEYIENRLYFVENKTKEKEKEKLVEAAQLQVQESVMIEEKVTTNLSEVTEMILNEKELAEHHATTQETSEILPVLLEVTSKVGFEGKVVTSQFEKNEGCVSIDDSFIEQITVEPITEELVNIGKIEYSHTEKQEEFTPMQRMYMVESVEKLKEIEEKIVYLKVGEIKQLLSEKDSEMTNQKKTSVTRFVETIFKQLEHRKQAKRYLEREKKKGDKS